MYYLYNRELSYLKRAHRVCWNSTGIKVKKILIHTIMGRFYYTKSKESPCKINIKALF